jgi:predicted metal-dependent HD superfamily phosphohydrolase
LTDSDILTNALIMLNLKPFIISQSLNEEEQIYFAKKANKLAELLNESFSNDDSKSIIYQMYKYYNQSHRHYHNLSHIYNLFKLNDQLSTDYHQLIEVTIWFHDVIYQPFYKNNEARSRDFFIKKLQKYPQHQLKTDEIEWINAAIMSTFGHTPKIESKEVELFLDMDLSILAVDWGTYQKYSEGVRKEYWIYPSVLYRKGRVKVLEHFLGRERIYYSSVFEEKESQARENLQREIEMLTF